MFNSGLIRNSYRERPTAVILGLSLTALGVIRSLGRKGIPLIGMDYKKGEIASYSKYCSFSYCPDPDQKGDELIRYMSGVAKQFQRKAVLIPTSDEFVLFISRNREKLGTDYNFVLPSSEVIEILNDKRRINKIAEENNIPVPATFFPKEVGEIGSISKVISYPCVIKPAYGYFYKYLKFKAILANNSGELIENYKKMHQHSDKILIQEFVSGRDDSQYSLGAYFDANCEPIAIFTARKIRQIPVQFGTGTFVESCIEPSITELGIPFLKRLGYRGVVEVEFKRDSKDNQLKMIEINTRVWTQNNLATRCGVDIPYISYLDMLGEKVERCSQKEEIIRWIDIYSDILTCFGLSGYIHKGEMTPATWFRSVSSAKEHAIFATDDMRPFVHATKIFISQFKNRLVHRWRNEGT